MKNKLLLLTLTILSQTVVFAQKDLLKTPEFGKHSKFEKEMLVYNKDSTANAVYLNEWGYSSFKLIDRKIRIVKEYYAKIKILKKEGFDYANIEIPIYHNKKTSENISKIAAMSTLNGVKTYLKKSKIYKTTYSENVDLMKFTIPNTKVGSIIEYRYTTESPFVFNFEGWDFQTDIPKVYSEFNAKIFGNYIYNRRLRGALKLSSNHATVEKNCFYLPNISKGASCEVLKYAMKDIPAFKEEDYMLSPKNYISSIKFELSEYKSFYKEVPDEKYTKSWETVDREFRRDKDIGGQLKKANYFEKKLPPNILLLPDALERAKEVYRYMQQHFRWNKEFGIFENDNIKRSYEAGIGNVAEINMSLVNALNAAKIPSKIMLLSTRANGLPTKSYPVMSDFNYLVATTEIAGKSYLLDATNKGLAFGMLPFRCLNYEGRVMDFKNESYWAPIKAGNQHIDNFHFNLKIGKDISSLEGVLRKSSIGYAAFSRRDKIKRQSKEDLLDHLEEQFDDAIIEEKEATKGLEDNESSVVEVYQIEIPLEDGLRPTTYINAFFGPTKIKNPFQLKDRLYPVDYGFHRKINYNLIFQVPEGYTATKSIENKRFSLPNKSAEVSLFCNISDTFVQIRFKFQINRSFFDVDYYASLKEFYNKVVELQKNAVIILKKK
ncbi:MAG: DUF3857 domain-containing protein [Flavobacteriaceae bacterium]|nr:DUF3857 domain-containing protein [Flavobacteriaceae bacterium]